MEEMKKDLSQEELQDEMPQENSAEDKEETTANSKKGSDKDGKMSETQNEEEGLSERSSKRKPLKKKRDKKDEKIEELNDRLIRNMAEFDNFRKRSEKEKSTMYEIGAKSIVEKILPVVDNLERGFDALSEEEREQPFAKGIEQIYKQFLTALEEVGVMPIEAVGKEFDPELHNAVMHDENENYGENTVSQELQKGYMYKDSVVRHSMVKVSN